MRQAVEKARVAGVATVVVRNSNHYASCFYYPLVAIAAGMAGMTITTSGPLTLPTFGMAPMLGTDPYAIGFPGGNVSPPFVIAMVTSAIAMGKVGIYRREGKTLPDGWTFDKDFQPTTDPQQARWLNLLGTDRAHGSHKGIVLNVAGISSAVCSPVGTTVRKCRLAARRCSAQPTCSPHGASMPLCR